MSPVSQADPAAQTLDAAFAEAMGAPPKPREPPAPAEVDPDAPHGRDDQGAPLEPFGRTKDGRIRRSPAGRPPKEDQPRTGPAPAAPAGKSNTDTPPAVLCRPGELSKELSDTADAVWFGMSALGKAAPAIPLVGGWAVRKGLPGRLQAQAAVWYATKDRAVAAVSLAAEHSASAARFARKLEGGDITWMITCLSLVAPIVSLSGTVWAGDADAQLAAAGQPSVADLAKKNEAAMDEAVRLMTAHVAQLAAEQAAAVQEAA